MKKNYWFDIALYIAGIIVLFYIRAVPLFEIDLPFPEHTVPERIANQMSANKGIYVWLFLSLLSILPWLVFSKFIIKNEKTAWIMVGYTNSLAISCVFLYFIPEDGVYFVASILFRLASSSFRELATTAAPIKTNPNRPA